MKLGISTVLFEKLSIEEAFYKLSNAHFKVLEVIADSGNHLDPQAFPRERLREVVELSQSLGLTLHSMHGPTGEVNMISRDEGIKRHSFKIIKEAIEYAEQVGCKYIIFHPGSPSGFEEPISSEERGTLVDSLKQISSYCLENGVHPLIENMPRNLSCYAGRCYGPSSVRDIVGIIQSVGSDLGICLDIGHSFLSRLDPIKEISEAGEYLFSVHVDENDLIDDLHLPPRKDGVSNSWNEIVNALSHHLDVFLLEVAGEDADKVLEECIDIPSWLPVRLG